LQADTPYSYRVVTWDGDDAGASEVLGFRTGQLPAGLPTFTAQGSFDSYVAVPLRGTSPAVVVLDPTGAIVWYHEDESGLDVLRAQFSRDGRSVIYNRTEVDADSSADSALVRVALDGSGSDEIRVPYLAHDFVELEDGRFAAIVVDRRDDADGDSVRGDAIVEIAADGSTTPVWSTWDSFDPEDAAGDGANDAWTYANALSYSSTEEAYYVGLQNFSSVLKIPIVGGAPEWVLGSTEATLAFAEGNVPFARQSGIARFTDDSMLVLDNEGGSGARLVEYSLAPEMGQAVQFGTYAPEPSISVGELGGIVRLPLGEWLISWGDAGRIELVDDENSVWSVRSDGTHLGYHAVTTSLYPDGTEGRNPLR
jgi:hypothetical protein